MKITDPPTSGTPRKKTKKSNNHIFQKATPPPKKNKQSENKSNKQDKKEQEKQPTDPNRKEKGLGCSLGSSLRGADLLHFADVRVLLRRGLGGPGAPEEFAGAAGPVALHWLGRARGALAGGGGGE